jgi:hypothetical protein
MRERLSRLASLISVLVGIVALALAGGGGVRGW